MYIHSHTHTVCLGTHDWICNSHLCGYKDYQDLDGKTNMLNIATGFIIYSVLRMSDLQCTGNNV